VAPDAVVAGATDPHAAPLQPAPDTVQLTPLFWLSLVTLATNVCVRSAVTLALIGAISTVITGPVVTVITADAVLVLSATDVAVSMTVAGEGGAAGAV
jgi:hypothetical protein